MSGRRLLIGVGLVAAAGAIAVVIALDGPSEGGQRSARPVTVANGVVGCRERVEGGRIAPRSGRDALIGPVAFYLLPENYAANSKPDPGRSPPEPGFNAHSIKSVLLVRSGERVTLEVPRAQRAWMRLLYSRAHRDRLGTERVTLQACRRTRSPAARRAECRWRPTSACRWKNTQFAGGVYVDFDRAPRRGRCATLRVRSARGEVHERPLFGGCGGDPRAIDAGRPADCPIGRPPTYRQPQVREPGVRVGTPELVLGCGALASAGRFQLVGYRFAHGGAGTLCIDVVYRRAMRGRGGQPVIVAEGCGDDRGADGIAIQGFSTEAARPHRLYGATSIIADEVVVSYELDGVKRRQRAELSHIGEGVAPKLRLRQPFAFYVAEVPRGAHAIEVEARDARGAKLARAKRP